MKKVRKSGTQSFNANISLSRIQNNIVQLYQKSPQTTAQTK